MTSLSEPIYDFSPQIPQNDEYDVNDLDGEIFAMLPEYELDQYELELFESYCV